MRLDVLNYLVPGTFYEFRIRSSNRTENIINETIWGYVGNFTTGVADSDLDGMDDDWELQYFNGLGRDGTGDFDSDGFLDINEFSYDKRIYCFFLIADNHANH